jgi:hypothetical protein
MICYIQQEEIYNSSTYDDRLNPLEAESSATTLEQDLNFIRSVILTIYGVDKSDPDNKWYRVPFFTLKYLYDTVENFRTTINTIIDQMNSGSGSQGFDDFEVEHYSSRENINLRGQHKSITARGTLTVYGSSTLKNGLTVEITDPLLDALWVKGKAKVDDSLTTNGATINNLDVNYLINAPTATSLLGNTTVSSLISNNDTSIGGSLNVSGSTTLFGIGTVNNNFIINGNLIISGVIV